MPKIKEIIGKVFSVNMPKRNKKSHVKDRYADSVCPEMIAIYKWLMKYRGKIPFYCLMLQEGASSSFLLNPDGEPAVFNEWGTVNRERDGTGNKNVWILEFKKIPN